MNGMKKFCDLRRVRKINSFKLIFCWPAPLNSIPYRRLRAEVFDEFLNLTEYDMPIYNMSMNIYLCMRIKS